MQETESPTGIVSSTGSSEVSPAGVGSSPSLVALVFLLCIIIIIIFTWGFGRLSKKLKEKLDN